MRDKQIDKMIILPISLNLLIINAIKKEINTRSQSNDLYPSIS